MDNSWFNKTALLGPTPLRNSIFVSKIDNYIFNRFSNHTFSDAERKLCIIELKPLLGDINIITETDISRRRQSGGKYIKLNAEIDDNIFYQKVQQIIQ